MLLLPLGCMSIAGLVAGRTSITSVLVSLIFFSYDKYLEGIFASEPLEPELERILFRFTRKVFFLLPLLFANPKPWGERKKSGIILPMVLLVISPMAETLLHSLGVL